VKPLFYNLKPCGQTLGLRSHEPTMTTKAMNKHMFNIIILSLVPIFISL